MLGVLQTNATGLMESLDLSLMSIFLERSRRKPSVEEIALQCILMFVSSIFTAAGVYVALKLTLGIKVDVPRSTINGLRLHRNLKLMFMTSLLWYGELVLSKMFTFIFQFDYNFFRCADASLLTSCESRGECSFGQNFWDAIFLAGLLRYHYIFYMSLTPCAIVLERLFATILIQDYEKRHRGWICAVILATSNAFSLGMSAVATTSGLNFAGTMLTVVSLMIFAAGTYLYLSYYNLQRLFILDHEHRRTNYSLSIRYQLKENIKTLKLMKQYFFTITMYTLILSASVSAPTILGLRQPIVVTWRSFLDDLFHANPLFMIPTAIVTVTDCRLIFIRELRRLLKLRPPPPPSNISLTVDGQHKVVSDADVYFEDFRKKLDTL